LNFSIIGKTIFPLCALMWVCPVTAFAERALETEGVKTLETGKVDVGLGLEYFENRQLAFDTSRVSREQTTIPAIGIAIGVAEHIEIQSDFDVFYLDEPGQDKTYDVGDLRLWTKLRIVDQTDSRPGLGIRFGTKLPNASNESRLGTDETDFFAELIIEKEIGAIETRANLGMGILGNPNENNSQDDVVTYAGALLYPISETSVTLFSEIFGTAASSEDNNYSSVRGGILIELTQDLELDLFGQAGITDESEDFAVGGGISWQFDAFQR
jgi:hypothetical protein